MPAAPAKPTAVDRKRLTLESWQVIVGAAGVIITLLVYLHKKAEGEQTPEEEHALPLPEAPAIPVAGGTAGGGVVSTYKPGEQVTKAGGEEKPKAGEETKKEEAKPPVKGETNEERHRKHEGKRPEPEAGETPNEEKRKKHEGKRPEPEAGETPNEEKRKHSGGAPESGHHKKPKPEPIPNSPHHKKSKEPIGTGTGKALSLV